MTATPRPLAGHAHGVGGGDATNGHGGKRDMDDTQRGWQAWHTAHQTAENALADLTALLMVIAPVVENDTPTPADIAELRRVYLDIKNNPAGE